MIAKSDAAAIIAAVKADPECRRRITSTLGEIVPDSFGIAGSLRNFGYMITFQDPIDEKVANLVCTGISDATASAIEAAVKKREPAMWKVAGAGSISRVRNGMHHTATAVIMTNKLIHVFDWHQTLKIRNPAIFPNIAKWKTEDGGVLFEDMDGVSLDPITSQRQA